MHKIVFRIACVIFAVELVIMKILEFIPHQFSTNLEAVIDSIALTVLSAPLIHLWIIKPTILARIAAENKLKKAHDALDTQVKNRTEELFNVNIELKNELKERKKLEKLHLQLKNLAEEANIAKSAFIANMSHEFRTPLHVIISYSQIGMQKGGNLSKNVLKYFQNINQCGDQLLHLVNDLLDISKLEAGKMELNLTEGDVNQLLADSIRGLDVSITKKELTVLFKEQLTSHRIVCDTERIKQVISNLLSNAIKFSPVGGVITLGAELKNRKNTPCVQVSIQDNGIGIPADEVKSVFDKFIQSSKTTLQHGGTGLGLAICKEIISHHSGEIWADTGLKKGAKLNFVLPLVVQSKKSELHLE